ncbi:MAG: zinc-ribbon domain-containing protein [Desulfocapsa sp.]|nr:zinc-ribbon domain-containing protein [Desulfocapsa sp.]
MKIDCPHCGVYGSVEDSLVRRKLRCPKCSKVFLVSDDLLPEADETNLKTCSVCSQSFASELLVDIDSQLYCVLCRPDFAVEAVEEAPEEDVLETVEEETIDLFAETEQILGPDVESEVASEEESITLETCSVCGDSLHPDFLETVGSQKYCALCLPDETEEAGIEEDEEPKVAAEALMSDEEELAGEDDLEKVCWGCGEKFHLDFLQEVDSKLYCGICQPDVIEGGVAEVREEIAVEAVPEGDIEELMAEALQEEAARKGEKGPNWAVLIAIAVLCGLAFWLFYKS